MEYAIGMIFGALGMKLHTWLISNKSKGNVPFTKRKKVNFYVEVENNEVNDEKLDDITDEYELKRESKRAYILKNPSEKGYLSLHGGCHGCTTPLKSGLGTCIRCQCFNADWKLPNLNINN